MKQTTKKVQEAGMELPEREKIRVVQKILARLEGEADLEAENSLTAEIEPVGFSCRALEKTSIDV
jgi:hypothetical protein